MGQSWNFREARCGNWSIEGEEGKGGIIVGNWVSRTTVSRKSHFQPSLAVKGSRADYRVAGGEISAVRARNDEFSSRPRLSAFSRGVGEFVLFPSNGTCSIIDALVNDLFLYRKQLRTEARGKKGKFVISSHASSRINPRIIDRIATALKREQKSTRVTMNWCCSRVWTMWAQRPSGLSTRTSTRRGSTAIGSPWRIWKVSYLFFFFYKPCTGHVMDTTSIVQFPYPSLCLLPKEKKKKKKKSQSSLSPHFVHPRCSRFYIRFVSPVCRTVFLHPPPFCASWINEQRGQKGRFIPPRDCGVFFLGTRKRGKRGSYPLSLSLIKSNSECLALLLDTLSRCEIESTINEFFYDLGVEGARHKEQFPLFYRTSWDNLKDKRGWKIRSGFVAWSWITIYW